MKTLASAVVLSWLSGCAAPSKTPAPPALAANFAIAVDEVVERAEDEGTSYAKIFVDGELAGQTAPGPRSQEKSWEGRLASGNRLIRVEYWILPGLGQWEKLPDEFQPRERFFRFEEASKTRLKVKFSEKGRRSAIEAAREPL